LALYGLGSLGGELPIVICKVAYTPVDPESAKKTVKFVNFLRFWDLHLQKLLVEHRWNWHLGSIFTYSFYNRSSQKRKNSVKLSVSFYTLGSTGAKAARRTLIKLTPGLFPCQIFLLCCQFYLKSVEWWQFSRNSV